MKCRFEHRGDCCNSGSSWYLCKCQQPCDTIIPMTNADRIRAMSDEEIAKVPAKFGYSCVFPQKECGESDTCEKCLLEWLKQPAE